MIYIWYIYRSLLSHLVINKGGDINHDLELAK
jgi:hypothetical protein